MRPWTIAALGAVLAATTVTASVLPSQRPVEPVRLDHGAQTSVVCPAFAPTVGRLEVVGYSPAELRVSTLSDPETVDTPGQVVRLVDTAAPVVMSAPAGEPFGATSLVAAPDGPDRGLSVLGCDNPATQAWFTGMEISRSSELALALVNTDLTDATVDLTAIGPDGPVNLVAARGLVVEARSARTVQIQAETAPGGPISLHLTTSSGRVSASLRQRSWSRDTVVGTEWVGASAEPELRAVVPVIPDTSANASLAVTNPGERTTTVTLDVLRTSGRSGLSGLETLDVPGGTTRTLEIGSSLGEDVAALQVSSERPVVVGLSGVLGSKDESSDPYHVAAQPPLPADGVWPLPGGSGARSQVVLANPGSQEVVAEVTLGNQALGPGEVSRQRIAAGAIVTVEVPSAQVQTVRIATSATELRAAVLTRRTVGKVSGIAVLGLVPGAVPAAGVDTIQDLRVGS